MPVWAVVKAKPTTDHVVAHSVLCSLLPALGAPVVLDSAKVVPESGGSESGSSSSSTSVSSSMVSFPLPRREGDFRGEGTGTFEAGGLRSSTSKSSSFPLNELESCGEQSESQEVVVYGVRTAASRRSVLSVRT